VLARNEEALMATGVHSVDLAVLGGGPGGYVAASVAAQRGARVALVEKERVGGTCLNVGCIPTKALLTSADSLSHAWRGTEFGLPIPSAEVDLPALMAYKRRAVDQLVGGVGMLLKGQKIATPGGKGALVRPDTLTVRSKEDVISEFSAPRIILAPGSITSAPPLAGQNLPGVITSTGALDIESVPPRLVIVGDGVIGVEFACIYEALGSKVTVLELTFGILPGATDEAISKGLLLLLRRREIDIQTGTVVRKIEHAGDGLRVAFQSNAVETSVDCDRVLIATGRWPNTAGKGLKEARLRMNGLAIQVDDYLATSVPNICAVGDAIGGWMLAHKAMVDGRVAAENATGGKRQVDYRSVPSVIFTRPEVASVGSTEAQARESGVEVKVVQSPFSANSRARTLGDPDGLVKLVCEAATGRILGVHMLGPHFTDLIAEGALAVQTGATADDLAWTTHAHPTLPEAVLEATLGFGDGAIHFHVR
jgi:dihydrolipoamide dehydrogenase